MAIETIGVKSMVLCWLVWILRKPYGIWEMYKICMLSWGTLKAEEMFRNITNFKSKLEKYPNTKQKGQSHFMVLLRFWWRSHSALCFQVRVSLDIWIPYRSHLSFPPGCELVYVYRSPWFQRKREKNSLRSIVIIIIIKKGAMRTLQRQKPSH